MDTAAPPTSPPTSQIPFDNSYARLPERFYARLPPTPVRAPSLIKVNTELAAVLGIDAAWLASPEGIEVLSGNRVPTGAEPIATAYAGHQFGGFVPQLGDGRAILLGEVVGRDGVRRDIQLKGAGPTPYSRRGDGRAALGPVLREYIVSEAMAALGIPTTRALAVVSTGEPVIREQVLPGAILTRVARSHIRVGTFQYFSVRGDVDGLRALADHVIARHYPAAATATRPYRALLDAIVAAQASLIARWMHVGFIHGVMNTDNCQVAGETIDYGPCAFMDNYDPGTVYSSIDHGGRYAYSNQPRLAQWNLGRLAEAMLPLLLPDGRLAELTTATEAEKAAAVAEAQSAVDGFAPVFDAAYWAGWFAKVGLAEAGDEDRPLLLSLLGAMTGSDSQPTPGADFTLTFRHLADAIEPGGPGEAALIALFSTPDRIRDWLPGWRARLSKANRDPAEVRASMRRVNPAFIPRNHRIEQAIVSAVAGDDFAPFGRLVAVLARPYDDQLEHTDLALPPNPNEVIQATFCGT
ncbi:MAG: YdiU family protein [Hyphomicrobiaceae bacterium]|nr:YdiU family protein [Hyphomicrobiaceae bacterium]